MNRKRKPEQRKRANKRADRRRKSRLGRHQLDVRVKRREGASIRRHFRIPIIAKIVAVATAIVITVFVTRNMLGRFLWNNPAYTLTTIEYDTDGWLSRPIALETACVEAGVNVLRLDLEDIRDKIVGLPQVKDATVIRVLPDRLLISVKERHPVAWLSCPEQNIYPKIKNNGILLDAEGVALPCAQMRPEYVNFPIVSAGGLAAIKHGAPVGSDQLVSALHLVSASAEILYDHALEIVEIKLVNDYSMLARFNNHTKVIFKPADVVRQVEDLRLIFEDSMRKNRLLETVNLLPERNIAITYVLSPAPGQPIPRREPPVLTDGLESPEAPRQARRAVRALRSIPTGHTPASTGPPLDPDLSSILNQQ